MAKLLSCVPYLLKKKPHLSLYQKRSYEKESYLTVTNLTINHARLYFF